MTVIKLYLSVGSWLKVTEYMWFLARYAFWSLNYLKWVGRIVG